MNEQHLTLETIIDYLHGELASDEDVRVLAHIEACESCHDAYESEARITDVLRAFKADERELPPGVVATIWDRIERESTPRWQMRFAWLMRPALFVPAAAILVIGAYFGVTGRHGGSQTSIDAAYYLDDHAALTRNVSFDEASSSVVPASLDNDDPEADQQWVATADIQTTNVSP